MLLERDDILDELDRLAGDAGQGRGAIAFVVGEAGIGKTSVLRAAAERLEGRIRCLWTACEDLSSAEALTVLRELPLIADELLDETSDRGSRLALFRDALTRLTATPTVLFIEDLHWADEGSIDFIRYVGRRVADQPLLLVLTSRNEEQDARARLTRTANDLPPKWRHRFDLDRLSSSAVGRLAAAQGLIGSSIHMVTNGNPLLVTELLANAGNRSHSFDELVNVRASRLAPEARAFLEFCSIVPRRVSVDQIEASGATEADVQACLDAGLLLPHAHGLAFRHELTRHAIEDALTPVRRKQLHSAELDRLDRAGASAARRLHHAISSDSRERIAELAPVAAEQAARLGAHGEAARAWSAMLDLADPPAEPSICERFAFELHMTGEMKRAIDWQNHALSLYVRAQDRLRQGDCLRFLSRLHYMCGERALAERTAEEAVAVLEPLGESAELAHAYATMAQLAMLDERNVEAIRYSELARPLAEKAGRDDVLSTILINFGTALQNSDIGAAIEMLDESIRLGRRSGSDEHVARAFINKSWTYMMRPAPKMALPILQEGIEFCREHEITNMRLYMLGGVALCQLDLGQWDDAFEQASALLSHPSNTSLTINPAMRVLAALYVRRGLPGASGPIADLRMHDERGREAPRFNSYVRRVAEAAWTAGEDCSEALSLLGAAAERLREDGNRWDRGTLWYWCRKLGAPCVPPGGLPKPFALLEQGDIEGAASAMQELCLPFHEALMLVEGNDEQALRGLAILDRLGAAATAARIRVELAERGVRKGLRGPRASTMSNQYGLTRREIDVLAAIDLGLTNKEIGEKLFVSAKTIDHHVSSILNKTDARTRGEAVALARRNGILNI